MPFRLPHPLRSAHPDCEGDRRRIRSSLSATSHDDAGNPASSDTFEATGERNLILSSTSVQEHPTASDRIPHETLHRSCARIWAARYNVANSYTRVSRFHSFADSRRWPPIPWRSCRNTTSSSATHSSSTWVALRRHRYHYPAVIQHVLKTNAENYQKSEIQVKRMGHFLGKGLLTTHGEAWRTQRRLIQKGFDRKQLEALSSIMQDSLTESMRDFDRQVHAGPVDIYPHLMKLPSPWSPGRVRRPSEGRRHRPRQPYHLHRPGIYRSQTIQPYLNPWFAASGELRSTKRCGPAPKHSHGYIKQRRHEEPGHDLLQT